MDLDSVWNIGPGFSVDWNIVPEISAEKYLIMDLVCNIWTLCVMLRISGFSVDKNTGHGFIVEFWTWTLC